MFALLFMVPAMAVDEGESMHGFKLLEKRFVDEVNAECLYFQHEKSGAKLFKIAADDPNKTFSIAFKTICNSNAGTPHILEHAVLNGSSNFPVKSPFDVLSKGSLNTFLNAMTGNDVTMYPVASMNDKDYFNLMHVYLDAVFNPLIYDEPDILKQEGWHHHLESVDGDMSYKGVVYNEMKGAFSNPGRELYHQMMKRLFPDTPYRFSSGGYPFDIPTLTYDSFIDFHRTFYHPENSHILLYGDADLASELEFIDREYLSKYEITGKLPTMPKQAPFDAMREDAAPYSIAEDATPEDQTYLSLSWVVGEITDRQLYLALQVLQQVLVRNESAPLRLALQDADVGRDVTTMLDDLQQMIFQVEVQNANIEDKALFLQTVNGALAALVENGLDKEAVQGALNQIAFRMREGDNSQKGLNYNWQIIGGWFWADDPFLGLEYEKTLASLEKAIAGGYLEKIIQKHLLDNPHALLLTMEPTPGLEAQNNSRIQAELEQHRNSLDDAGIAVLVADTRKLMDRQKKEDSAEALATIPLLTLADINPTAEHFSVKKGKAAKVPYLHHNTFSGGVVYTRQYYDLRVLPKHLLPYAALLAEAMGALNTTNYSYGDLEKAFDLNTGGYSTFLISYREEEDDSRLVPKFVVYGKAMNDKVDRLYELLAEMTTQSIYDDADRLKEVFSRHQSRMENQVKSNGLGYAISRLESYYSNAGAFSENTSGLDYYWFVTDLVENFDSQSSKTIERLQKTAELLFTRNNLMASATCDKSDLRHFKAGLKSYAKLLPEREVDYISWRFNLEKKNEGLLAASKVQYVVQGYNFKKLGYQYDGKMRVMNQALSRDYVRNQVRVIGGAYGGWASLSKNGMFYFGSYRDPNLTETLENYDTTPEYLRTFEAGESEMTRYIIGTIARMDRPMTPRQRGNMAVQYWFEGTSAEDLQAERNAVLAVTPKDIRSYEKMIVDILAQDSYCVYGNEDKLRDNEEIFGTLVNLSE